MYVLDAQHQPGTHGSGQAAGQERAAEREAMGE
jgi:hypothetical protein